jgi:multidrug efflux pump subunit AcrA (membrane-fusion protein)
LIVLEMIKSFSRHAVSDWGAEGQWGEGAKPGVLGSRGAVPGPASQSARKSGVGWRMAAGALAVLVFGGGWLTWSLYRDLATHYVTQKLERGSVVRSVTASGVVGPTATAPVGARVSGVIQALYCDANMKVKAGQLCAKIDPRPYQTVADQDKARLAAAVARLEKHKANLVQAKAAFERHELLAKRRAMSRKALGTSRKAYERAQTQMNLDEATVAQLQASLRAAEINLGYTDIVSPIDGTVVSRNVEIGSQSRRAQRRRRSSSSLRNSASFTSTPMSARRTSARSSSATRLRSRSRLSRTTRSLDTSHKSVHRRRPMSASRSMM